MPRVLVLCYHGVSDDWDSDLSVTPQRLERQVRLLLRRGYRPTTFDEAVSAPPARRTLAVTFDDGYRSVRERAWPVLSRLGVPASVFVPTALMGQAEPLRWEGIEGYHDTPHAAELTPMDWDELRWLAWRGWEVGSHTRVHPHLTRTDDATLAAELGESRAAVEEQLERPCRSLAYPYGDVDARVVAATRDAGYAGACTLSAVDDPDPLTFPRVALYQPDHGVRLRLKLATRLRRLASRGSG